MVALAAPAYRPGKARLHRFDVRMKLFALVMLSVVTANATAWGLMLATFLVWAGARNAHLPLPHLFSELRYFAVFLGLVWIVRSLTVPGTAIIHLPFADVSREGVVDGALICWRLILVVLLGVILVSTSRNADIRSAIEWFLKPLPGIPHKRLGTMIGLMVRFVPVVFEQINEIMDAQRARGVENRKNPFYRMSRLVKPVMLKTFARADKLAVAMEARCYSENRADPVFNAGPADWLTLGGVCLFCLAIYLA